MARARRTRTTVGDLVIVLLVLVVAALALRLQTEAASARASAEAAAAAFVRDQAPAEARERRSFWFGDSIVEGCCRERGDAPSMAQVAATKLGWAPPIIQGSGGTGYVTAGPVAGRRPYTERFPREARAVRTDVVIIEGGGNDPAAPEPLRRAVRQVLDQAQAQFPDAQIVVVGPYSPNGVGYDVQRQVIGEEAAARGLPFVDQVALGWMRDRPEYLSDDRFHPNAAGHAYLGERLAQELADVLRGV